VPDEIRGYGHVKAKSLTRAQALRNQFLVVLQQTQAPQSIPAKAPKEAAPA